MKSLFRRSVIESRANLLNLKMKPGSLRGVKVNEIVQTDFCLFGHEKKARGAKALSCVVILRHVSLNKINYFHVFFIARLQEKSCSLEEAFLKQFFPLASSACCTQLDLILLPACVAFIKGCAPGGRKGELPARSFKYTRGKEKKLNLISPNGHLRRKMEIVEIDGPDEGENVISTAQSFPICFSFGLWWPGVPPSSKKQKHTTEKTGGRKFVVFRKNFLLFVFFFVFIRCFPQN